MERAGHLLPPRSGEWGQARGRHRRNKGMRRKPQECKIGTNHIPFSAFSTLSKSLCPPFFVTGTTPFSMKFPLLDKIL
jgi:hypothetical protein